MFFFSDFIKLLVVVENHQSLKWSIYNLHGFIITSPHTDGDNRFYTRKQRDGENI